jgi:hypothetical protein
MSLKENARIGKRNIAQGTEEQTKARIFDRPQTHTDKLRCRIHSNTPGRYSGRQSRSWPPRWPPAEITHELSKVIKTS